MKSRSEKIVLNSTVSFVLELVTIVSGIILPKLIIEKYGSEVNGLITSITQFLAYLTLLEAGVGGVVKAALYKPLEKKDTIKISQIHKSTQLFFRKLALISIVYIAGLCALYPIIVKDEFDTLYTIGLVLILGMGTVAQYLFGISYSMILSADQRDYLVNSISIITITSNLLITILLITLGSSIHIVKLLSSIVFVTKPIVIYFITKKKYNINSNVEPDNTAIKQRWYGVGFTVASFVHKKTDIFILTLASSLSLVSVYSIYSVVLHGINSLVGTFTNSFQAAFGNMMAKDEKGVIENRFRLLLLLSNFLVAVIFSITIVQIIPFVELYTAKITDVNYIYVPFAITITVAEMVFVLRQPYQAIITAAGKFKETTVGAYIEALINITVSLILLKPLGLLGIAIGTLLSMIFRIVDYANFLRKNIVFYKACEFLRRNAITAIDIALIVTICRFINFSNLNWVYWIINSVLDTIIAIILTFVLNWLFYKNETKQLAYHISMIGRKVWRKKN